MNFLEDYPDKCIRLLFFCRHDFPNKRPILHEAVPSSSLPVLKLHHRSLNIDWGSDAVPGKGCNMKRAFLGVFCILVIFSGCGRKDAELVITEIGPQAAAASVVQDTGPEEGKPLIVVNPDDTVIILVRADGAPGMYLGDDGEVHGFYVDLEAMIMKEMGQKYRFEAYSDVGPVIQAMKSGTHHIALAVPDLLDYRTFLNLSIPYEVLNYVTFVRAGNTEIKGNTRDELIHSLFGKKVGVQTQGHIFQVLREYKDIQLVEYPTTTQALEDLNKGLLDAVPDVKRIGLYYSAKNKWDIVPVGEPIIRHYLTTGFSQVFDSSLVERYNTAVRTLQRDGRIEALFARYFGPMTAESRP